MVEIPALLLRTDKYLNRLLFSSVRQTENRTLKNKDFFRDLHHPAPTKILFSSRSHPSTMPGMDFRRSLFIIVLIIITLVVAIMLNTGGPFPGQENPNGTLTGNVSIGPLCPVEPCSISHDQIVAAYATRPITITTAGGTFVGSVIPDPDTGYSISLRPGTYVVDTRHQGVGGSNLPKTVSIRPGGTVQLDISIDTGIR
jgi:hypothetical protein